MNKQNRVFHFFFFLLGVISIISQVLIFRELIISFYGNEFFTSLMLGSWLFWVAMGSFCLVQFFQKNKSHFKIIIACFFLIPVLFFLQIILIRFLGNQTEFSGEIPNLIYSILVALFVPAPLCLILGLQFSLIAKIFSKKIKSAVDSVSQGYIWETLGFIIGALLFSFWLVRIIDFNHNTMAWRFGNQQLLESTNSFYGNIAVTQTGEQYNFYQNGLLTGSIQDTGSPRQDVMSSDEELAHFSLLQHPKPEKILLIGGGYSGLLNEILKHPVQEIYYLELDPQFIKTIQKYLPLEIKNALTNEKVKIIYIDAYYFLNNTEEKFDVIIINLPNPSTALLNRFYTQEFFQQTKTKLKLDGLLATRLSFSPTQPNQNLLNLNASLFRTLKSVFKQIIILPEDINLFLASENNVLTLDSDLLVERYEQRELNNAFVTPNYVRYRITDNRIAEFIQGFEKNKQAQINKNFQPVSYWYSTIFWLSIFHSRLARIISSLNSLFIWLVLALILIGLSIFFAKRKNRSEIFPFLSMALAGFGLMAQEVIIIFAYQTICGYLYFRLALLIAAIMAGLALGNFYGQRKIKRSDLLRKSDLLKLHFPLIISLLILFLILQFFSQSPIKFWQEELIFIFLAIMAGFFPGMIFPLANKIYFQNKENQNKKIAAIYSADLIGSCLGALTTGTILIPVIGVFQTLILLLVFNLWFIISFYSPKTWALKV